MLSAQRVFLEIHDHDETFRLLCSIAAADEEHGGWENGRIAALLPDRERELAYKVSRHGADEDKHARIFRALLKKRGLDETAFSAEADYMGQLARHGIGVAHDRLRRGERLDTADVVDYLVHSRVTEQRAADDIHMMRQAMAERPDMLRALTVIARDEDNHLSYAHEELLRLASSSPALATRIRRSLRRTALLEIRVHRDVSVTVTAAMARHLGWTPARARLLSTAIHAQYQYERAVGWRRLTRLRMPPPERRNALGRPTPTSTATADPETVR